MRTLLLTIGRLLARQEGASVGEYAVALMLIAIVTIAAISLLGNHLSTFLTNAATTI